MLLLMLQDSNTVSVKLLERKYFMAHPTAPVVYSANLCQFGHTNHTQMHAHLCY